MFAFLKDELEARKSLKVFFLQHRQPKRNMCGFGLQRSFGRNILELLVYYLNTIKEGKAGVQYSMERKSTKRRLNRLWDTEWL